MHVTFQMNICIKIHIAYVKTHEMGLEENYECMHRSLTFKEGFFSKLTVKTMQKKLSNKSLHTSTLYNYKGSS